MLLNATDLSKIIASRTLFEGVCLNVQPRDKIGLIGPNGAGKSTLLKMLAGLTEPDGGTITTAKNLRVAYLAQSDDFPPDSTLEQVVLHALENTPLDPHEKATHAAIHLTKLGFTQRDAKVENLSGGWRKRLAIATQLAREPDLLLLDEPTNHLDLEGIEWLEDFLKNARFAFIVISHDRTFLEGAVTSVIEINDCFPKGSFRADGNYSYFLTHRKAFLEAQLSQMESTASKARREDAWLKQGIKARGTRARARSSNAESLFEELQALKDRTIEPKSLVLEFQDTERKTKRLIVAHNLHKSLGTKNLVKKLNLTLSPGMRLGLIGYNGSGKTTLLKLLCGEMQPDMGSVVTAPGIRIAMFDQTRQLVNKNQSLREALTPQGGDSVVYQDRLVHVASWAHQLKFRSDQLDTPVASLSGGEQARILLSQLMLTKADVLILDEPTNDLDIPALEVLEESLKQFPGAVILVTHDRAMLDRVSTLLLGLDGQGNITPYASVEQWQNAVHPTTPFSAKPMAKTPVLKPTPVALENTPIKKRKLSYKEQRELGLMEATILEAETALQNLHKTPPPTTDHTRMTAYYATLTTQQQAIDTLYARWAELDKLAE